MRLKIRNTEVISIRVKGDFYYELNKRADIKHLSIFDYVKNALKQYTNYKGEV